MTNDKSDLMRVRQHAHRRLQEEAEQVALDGHAAATRDTQHLEAIATRIVGFIDEMQPAFDRLDAARDVTVRTGRNGLRRERAPWRRHHLCERLAEAFDGTLSPGGAAFLSAAVDVEATGAPSLSNL